MKQSPADVYKAIADPTRRAILNLLSEADRPVNELAIPFRMSQPAISQHLKVLREAGLVTVKREGRQRLYHMEPGPLREVYNWLEHFEQYWERKLDALGTYLDRQK